MNLDLAKVRLLSLSVNSPGWAVVLEILEEECQVAEAKLLLAAPHETQKVLSLHNRAQAFRILFESFKLTVSQALAIDKPELPELSPEEIMRIQVGL